MNAQNVESKPKIKKNTKNKIRVDFERAPLKERLKSKLLSLFFLKKVIWIIFRFVLLVGISYVVLSPFIPKIASSFMAPQDFADVTVNLIPKNWSLDMYTTIWKENEYLQAFFNTLFLSATTALIQTFICAFVSYGLAKFKFKGNGFIFICVMITLAIPHRTLRLAMNEHFNNFDILNILSTLNGQGVSAITEPVNSILSVFLKGEALDTARDNFAGFLNNSGIANILNSIDIIPSQTTGIWSRFSDTKQGVQLINTYWPLVILSLGGLAFKNGLYIFLLRQFFKGVPDELEESAYIDGSGIMRTFFTIILPLSVPMLITVFLFSFSWQWTDNFYTTTFFTTGGSIKLMPDVAVVPKSLESITNTVDELYKPAVTNTAGLMIIAPLVVMYLFCQRYLVQGIERSGLTAD